MGASIAEQFLTAVQEHHEYIPIHIASLRVKTVTGFDMYLQVRPNEPAVLYAERTTPFSETSRNRLLDNNIEYLFISSDQQAQYRRYLENYLPEILRDDEIAVGEKSDILYASVHGLMRDLCENPSMKDGLIRSRDLARCTIGFMQHQRQALRHLITSASTDYEMYTHAVNGFVLGAGLASRLDTSDFRDMNEFGSGALLRDLGMTRVPESIREHTGKLTVSQFEFLKRHCAFGEEMARSLGESNPTSLSLIRHHHERLDGSGYPDGLSGDQIPPLVRVLAISDTFDALTTHRRHQRALNTYDALKLMKARMSHELDEDLLDMFIQMMGNPEG